ncbi:MAG: hypothetical protein ACOYXB_05975 [Bacteroidota bacterium]
MILKQASINHNDKMVNKNRLNMVNWSGFSTSKGDALGVAEGSDVAIPALVKQQARP